MVDYRYATTSEIKKINIEAVAKSLNRAASDECIDALDPNGKHLLVGTYVLDDGQTYRHEWLLKISGSTEPVKVFIDTTEPGTNAHVIVEGLPTYPKLVSQQEDTVHA